MESLLMKCDKFNLLKNLLGNASSTMILEAHNGLSAKIVEQAGFSAIWASGLSISAALGLRDCNEASWSQVLDVVEFMNDSVDIPVLFDGDSGFGNYNNVRHVVKKLSRYGVAGISLEDKLFPKLNSFIKGSQSLTPIDEFVGKLKAARDAAAHYDFSIIARTEALIAGLGVDEAFKRAQAYHEAGANAIFIHSKQSCGSEIIEFAKRWEKRCPLVVAPTTYTDMPVEVLEQAGVSIYICANHLMRASIASMQAVAKQIKQQNSIANLDDDIASLSTVFDLLDYDELQAAEKIYTPMKIDA
jgi:phosphoenolpyruvate mutase